MLLIKVYWGGVARGKRLSHFIWLTVMKLELEKS